jgi:hypothetical protein
VIYKFYRFLPAFEDIYQSFGRNSKLAGHIQASATSQAGALIDSGAEIKCSHATEILEGGSNNVE